jgi:hypothetical protein
MLLYGISTDDVASVVVRPRACARDDRGNARLVGETPGGRSILVVVAKEDPEFVITVFPRS